MNITIISVGKLKENYLKQGISEYQKRLKNYAKLKIIEVPDEATPDKLSQHEADLIKEKEADRIRQHIHPDAKVIVLAIEGKLISSEDLAENLESAASYGQSKINFIIGGSLGLADSLKKEADASISFGRITLPHQLMRLVLLEQIYRAFRIIKGHAYHK